MKSKSLLSLLSAALLLPLALSCGQKIECSVPAHIEDGRIVLETPPREKGQQSALLMRCEPLDTVRIGIIGVGMRGRSAITRLSRINGARITAICDIKSECIEKAERILKRQGCTGVRVYGGDGGWKELCAAEDVNLVYICTDWKKHTPMAVHAMQQGKHVAVEVPAAMSIAECWDLVNTCEKTRRHCMMLENCVYDFYEMSALNMAQQGLFGDIYHVEGAYVHNLDHYWTEYQDNWRLEYNRDHRGDNYPTHGIGPVCQVLDIHRGDRMDYLVSQDSDSFHGAAVAKELMGSEEFADGDHTVTLIRTVKGRQIEIQHNVYAARPYSRMYSITGTKGYASKYPNRSLAVGDDPEHFAAPEKVDSLLEAYKFDFVREIEDKAREVGGHGGMDYIMDYRLVRALREGLPLDQDVYDAAEWSCLTELSELSIRYGSLPVAVPDFTRGEWDVIDGFRY